MHVRLESLTYLRTANLATERRGLVYWWQFAFANWGLYLTNPNHPEVQEAPLWRI